MKKILIALCLITLMSTPAFALFNNGGFESGDFTGWTVTPGAYYGGYTFTPNASGGGYSYYPAQVIDSSKVADAMHYPYIPGIYNGSKMAVLNDAYGDNDATRISQTDTVTAADIAAGGSISVNWGTVLDDPQHYAYEEPYFDIEILNNGVVVATFSADASQHTGWTNVGSYAYSGDTLWYKSGQFLLPMSGFAQGDSVTVRLTVFDCALGGHGGYAFLDGIQSGTPPPPPNGVPEPATLLLLGSGLVGLVGLRKKFIK